MRHNLGNAVTDTLSTLVGSTNSKIVFSSNVTPDIEINIADLLKSGNTEPQQVIQSKGDQAMLRLIRPQVSVRVAGFDRSIAPFGPPIRHAWIIALAMLATAGLLGARIAWALCKRVPS